MKEHFKDSGERLSDFEYYRIIECPSCQKPVDFFNLQITCIQCGYNKQFEKEDSRFPYFILNGSVPIIDYLQIPCCGEELWAYNLEHLIFIEDYVTANIRSRKPNINKSLISRLPQWIKSAKNREQIVKAIQSLKQKLETNNYKKRVPPLP